MVKEFTHRDVYTLNNMFETKSGGGGGGVSILRNESYIVLGEIQIVCNTVSVATSNQLHQDTYI